MRDRASLCRQSSFLQYKGRFIGSLSATLDAVLCVDQPRDSRQEVGHLLGVNDNADDQRSDHDGAEGDGNDERVFKWREQ